MLKAVLSWGKILLWMPVIGFFVVLVSFCPEHRRPPVKETTGKKARWGFAFLNREKSASQTISPEKARESLL